jgi:hypothetical protein
VVRVPGYRSRGPGSIPGATRVFEVVGTIEELLERKVAALVYKTEITAVGIRYADHVAPSSPQKVTLTSGGRPVGIVRSRAQATELKLLYPNQRKEE